ncbi:hypothetical protein llap_15426 [Limosa lapponica baueri]|uniref:mRNA decay factor PAT1 domain-containing protein n=1 Tax=Limosa lapponica baueri TaxID=1758121 RepID=A0A2I0TKD2_LIMLA|nr:hypothetical protein llap_15426 [Limosa lapponica baueri]
MMLLGGEKDSALSSSVEKNQMLEDYLLVEGEPLLEEMAEEDEELDLYNEMTFGLDRDSTEEDAVNALMPLEMSPELAEVVAEETEAGEELEPGAVEQPEKLGEPQEEGGMELEFEQFGSELEEEEELGTEEQEEDEEPCEKPNDLGDPAVIRAVRSKPTLESQDSAVLDSRIGACWAEFGKEDMDEALLQVLERPSPSTNVALDFLCSPVQRGYGGSPGLRHPDLRLMSPKSFPQHILRQAAGSHRLRALHRTEKLFLQLLKVEEMQRKMSLALEEEQPCCREQKSQEVERIYQVLKIRACSSEEEAEDEFLQLLCVRKGKKLVARLLPHLPREQAEKILLTITHHLTFLMKKDVLDESLSLLYSPLNKVVGGMAFSKLIEVLQEMTRPLPESPELPLAMALKNQFGISLLYSLLSHGERLLSSNAPLEPRSGDFETWTDTVFLVARELSQVPKTLLVEPLFLPSNLLSLFCRYLDKQTVHQLEAKME